MLDPRKTPVQARSTASVEAILDATIQVLLQVGKERLTTTRVAYRAGVSVGTLYQYFPNKSALLQATLKRHMEALLEAVERACRELTGKPLGEMATGLIEGFLQAKMMSAKTSLAMYSVSSDMDGAKIVRLMEARSNKAIAAMLASSSDALNKDPQMVAAVLQGAIAGVKRRLLESGAREKDFEDVRKELLFMATAYLQACSRQAPVPVQPAT
jgi:AcrR family transcriptional regulator